MQPVQSLLSNEHPYALPITTLTSRRIKHLTHLPPPTPRLTARRALVQALLHPIRQLPPPSHLLILRHPLHVALEIRTPVLEAREKQTQGLVVEDAVIVDVAGGDAREDARPDRGVEGDILGGGGRLEADYLGVAF